MYNRYISNIFLVMSMICVFLSLFTWVTAGPLPVDQASGERWSVFVGLWVPTLLLLSNRFNKPNSFPL